MSWLIGWFVGWLAGWLNDWLIVWLVGWLVGGLAGWLAGWWVAWLNDGLVGWLVVHLRLAWLLAGGRLGHLAVEGAGPPGGRLASGHSGQFPFSGCLLAASRTTLVS